MQWLRWACCCADAFRPCEWFSHWFHLHARFCVYSEIKKNNSQSNPHIQNILSLLLYARYKFITWNNFGVKRQFNSLKKFIHSFAHSMWTCFFKFVNFCHCVPKFVFLFNDFFVAAHQPAKWISNWLKKTISTVSNWLFFESEMCLKLNEWMAWAQNHSRRESTAYNFRKDNWNETETEEERKGERERNTKTNIRGTDKELLCVRLTFRNEPFSDFPRKYRRVLSFVLFDFRYNGRRCNFWFRTTYQTGWTKRTCKKKTHKNETSQ